VNKLEIILVIISKDITFL